MFVSWFSRLFFSLAELGAWASSFRHTSFFCCYELNKCFSVWSSQVLFLSHSLFLQVVPYFAVKSAACFYMKQVPYAFVLLLNSMNSQFIEFSNNWMHDTACDAATEPHIFYRTLLRLIFSQELDLRCFPMAPVIRNPDVYLTARDKHFIRIDVATNELREGLWVRC